MILAVRIGDDAVQNDIYAIADNTRVSGANAGMSLYYDDRASLPRFNQIRHLVTVDDNPPGRAGANDHAVTPGRDVVLGVSYTDDVGNDAALMIGGSRFHGGRLRNPVTDNARDDLRLWGKSNGGFNMPGRGYGGMAIDRLLTYRERYGFRALFNSKMPDTRVETVLHSFDCGSRVEWFVDKSNIDATDNIVYDITKPVKMGPVSPPPGANTGTWDFDKYYPSVVFKDDVYHAWMGSYTASGVRTGCTYETSLDGITWTKPNLGQVTYEGGTDNNIILNGGYDHTVIWDGSQYVLQVGASDETGGTLDSNHAIYTSVDGVTDWTLQKQLTTAYYAEHHGFGRRTDGRWISYYTRDHGDDLRKIGALMSDTADITGTWTDQGVLSGLTCFDDAVQIYNFSPSTHHGVMYGISCPFDDISERIHMSLFTSLADDGLTWTSQDGSWLPHGKYGEFDGGMADGKHMIDTGEELRIYYFGSVGTHIDPLTRDSRLCYASVPSGRLGVVKSADGSITTTAIQATSALKVNAVSSGGKLTVELLDASTDAVIAGFARADCDALDGDVRDLAVTWGGQQMPTDQAYKIKFYLTE